MFKTIDSLSYKSKNLYNYANYLIRQEFINNNKIIKYGEMDKILQKHELYRDFGSQVSQQTLRLLDKNWKSFFKSIKDWSKNKGKYLGKPNLPNYKSKDGRFIVMIKNIQCHLNNGELRFSWKPLRDFKFKIPIQGRILQVRFIPRSGYYMMEVVYEIKEVAPKEFKDKIIGIDIGVDNLATVVNNFNQIPFIINGKPLKSMNQYYNKKKADIQSELQKSNNLKWSNRLQILTDKRYFKIKDYMHKSSKFVIDYCIAFDVDAIVIGNNKKWKQNSKMSKKVNQNFGQIPFDMFIKQIQYKAENHGIKVILTEESYTSGTSFLDNELPIKKNYNKARRFKRGLFKSNNGTIINSDVNGAYQIIKKEFPKIFNGIEDVGLHPVRVNMD